ncbi:anthranilate phosphoribosyltransferase [Candidatus Pelagibacter sp.]|nr:anthranilate phosphoribosyltransferase [Candidatus Pelagibacter sp.]
MENSLKKLKDKIDLNFNETKDIFIKIMNGEASEVEMQEFLTLLSNKGEVSSEIAAGVFVLREKSTRVNVKNAIDTCGTGGDGKNTLNISTASALLLASMGIKVAKHGNKAVSSKCGSGDVLEKLNININLDAKSVENNINKFNFGFMYAPNFHSAMKYVGPVRKKIGKRTIFNMIGPLSSPALVKKQVVGVFDKRLLNIFANALKELEITNAWIVNSNDGLDEISPYAITNVCQLKNGEISNILINPSELKINTNGFDTILGKDANYNSQKIIDIFKGEDNDFSIAVCLNAAAGLIVSENKDSFKEAYQETRDHILTGKTYNYLKKIQNGV